MDTICRECNQSFETVSGLHRHIKTHNLEQPAYYHKYFPRKDKFSGELIKFRTVEDYFADDFNGRANLASWLKGQTKEVAARYCKDLLQKHKAAKELVYTPTQVELRSRALIPSMVTFQNLFDYYEYCGQIGLKNKFKHYYADEAKYSEFTNLEYHLVVDTREQKPLEFDYRTQIGKLDFGDYGFSHPEKVGNIYIERKSLSDFISTISGGYERFQRELTRAQEAGAYLFIMVEDKLDNVMAFDSIKWIARNTKATPSFIFHRVREILQEFPNLQFVFPGNRMCCEQLIKKIFFSVPSGLFKTVDVQYLIDRKMI